MTKNERCWLRLISGAYGVLFLMMVLISCDGSESSGTSDPLGAEDDLTIVDNHMPDGMSDYFPRFEVGDTVLYVLSGVRLYGAGLHTFSGESRWTVVSLQDSYYPARWDIVEDRSLRYINNYWPWDTVDITETSVFSIWEDESHTITNGHIDFSDFTVPRLMLSHTAAIVTHTKPTSIYLLEKTLTLQRDVGITSFRIRTKYSESWGYARVQ